MSNWHGPMNTWLCERAIREYESQLAAHIKARRARSTFRYSVPDWQEDIIDAMNRGDEETAKAIKLGMVCCARR